MRDILWDLIDTHVLLETIATMSRVLEFWIIVCQAYSVLMARDNHSVVAVLRRDVILPCTYRISAPCMVSDFRVYWQIAVNGKVTLVHFLDHDQKEDLAYQSPTYQRRTKLFWSQLEQGNFSLLLSNVHIQDTGRYECIIQRRNSPVDQSRTVELQVAAHYNEPITESNAQCSNRTSTISCIATGGYPEPEVHWTINGAHVPDDPSHLKTEVVQDPTEKTYSVRSNLTIPSSTDADVRCTIGNKLLGESKSTAQRFCHTNGAPATCVQVLSLIAASVYLLLEWIRWQY